MCSVKKIVALKAFRVIFFFTISFIFLIAISLNTAKPIFKDYSDNYELYLNENSSNASIISVNQTTYPFIHNKYGESCTVNKDFDIMAFFGEMSADLVFIEKLDNGICYYAYSPKIKYKKSIGQKIVNLHVFIGTDRIKIGSPLIYGGY